MEGVSQSTSFEMEVMAVVVAFDDPEILEDELDLSEDGVDPDEAAAYVQFAADSAPPARRAPKKLAEAKPKKTPKPRKIPVLVLDVEWASAANCMGVDPDLFFPERGASKREAKEVCRGCVVREDCLEYAIANGEKFGIWGGLSERERRRIRRKRATAKRAAAKEAKERKAQAKKEADEAAPVVDEPKPAPVTVVSFPADMPAQVIEALKAHGGSIGLDSGQTLARLEKAMGLKGRGGREPLKRCLAEMERRCQIVVDRRVGLVYSITLTRVKKRAPGAPPAPLPPTPMQLKPVSRSMDPVISQGVLELLEVNDGYIQDPTGFTVGIVAAALGLSTPYQRNRLATTLQAMDAAGLIDRDSSRGRTRSISLSDVEIPGPEGSAEPEPDLDPDPVPLAEEPAPVVQQPQSELAQRVISLLQSRGGFIADSSGSAGAIVAAELGLATGAGRQRLLILLGGMEEQGLIVRDKTPKRTYSIGLPGVTVEMPQASPKPAARPQASNLPSHAEIKRCITNLLNERGGYIRDDFGGVTKIILEAIHLSSSAARGRLTDCLRAMHEEGSIEWNKTDKRLYSVSLPGVFVPTPVPFDPEAPQKSLIAHLRSMGGQVHDPEGRVLEILCREMKATSKDDRMSLILAINNGVAFTTFGRVGPPDRPVLLRLNA